MRLRTVLFAGPAKRQLDDILEESEEKFGPAARERYESPVLQALEDLLDNPVRPGVRPVAGRLHDHLRHSRTRVPKERGRVGAPRHLIVARVVGGIRSSWRSAMTEWSTHSQCGSRKAKMVDADRHCRVIGTA